MLSHPTARETVYAVSEADTYASTGCPALERLQGLSRRRQLVGLRVADKNRHRHDPSPTPAALDAAGVGTGRGALGQRYIMSMSFIALISSSEVPMP